jgi:hypothetical protein
MLISVSSGAITICQRLPCASNHPTAHWLV